MTPNASPGIRRDGSLRRTPAARPRQPLAAGLGGWWGPLRQVLWARPRAGSHLRGEAGGGAAYQSVAASAAPPACVPSPEAAPTPTPGVAEEDLDLVSASGLFDPAFYRKQLRRRGVSFADFATGSAMVASPALAGGVAASTRALLIHFVACGGSAGLSPHPLFDAATYLLGNPDVAAAGMNPLIHYLRHGFREARQPSPLFNPAFYLRSNPDLPLDLNLLIHFVKYGAGEGRCGWSAEDAERVVAAASSPSHDRPCLARRSLAAAATGSVGAWRRHAGVYAPRDAAPATHELCDLLAEWLRRCGVAPVLLDEDAAPPAGLDDLIVVSPHAFFGPNLRGQAPHGFPLERAVVFNTESPQSPAFARSLPLFCRAAAVLDSDPAAVAILQRLGIDGFFLPLVPAARTSNDEPDTELPDSPFTRALSPAVRQFRAADGDPFCSRPLDVLFVGAATERRQQFFARSAAAFSRFSCFLHLPDVAPWGGADDALLATATEVGLARRARIVLNVHAAAGPGFEWQRIVLHGLAQGALVVSEPCTPIPELRAGEHFIEAPMHEIPDLIHWLLSTQAGERLAEQIRGRAAAVLCEHFDPRDLIGSLLPALRRLAAS